MNRSKKFAAVFLFYTKSCKLTYYQFYILLINYIFNLVAQVGKVGNMNEREISVAKLEAGMYIFEAHDDEKTTSKKFVKK